MKIKRWGCGAHAFGIARVAHAFDADPQVLDRVPRLIYRVLYCECASELGGHQAQESGHRLSIVVLVFIIRLLPDAMAYDVPDTKRLEVHFHDQCPLQIVGPSEHQPRDVGGRPLDDALVTRRPVSRVRGRQEWERPRRHGERMAEGVSCRRSRHQ